MNAQPDLFTTATSARSLGDGSYTAHLHSDWSIRHRPHSGYLLALLARTAGDATRLSPLSVSAQFLEPPRVGPVLVRLEIVKAGHMVTVVRAVLEQSGRKCVDTTMSLGTVPEGDPAWSDLPEMPVNPPADAVDLGSSGAETISALSHTCEVRISRQDAGFLRGSKDAPPGMRLWARPRASQPDLLFGLFAADLSVPVTLNRGRGGWSPAVQRTALLRAHPANGWLRLVVESRAVHGRWFDEDTLVIDSTGRLICQSRQLALAAE